MLRRTPKDRQRHAVRLWDSCQRDVAETQHGVHVAREIAQAVVTAFDHHLPTALVAGHRRAIVEHLVGRGSNKEIALRADRFDFQGAQLLDVARRELVALAGMKILLWPEMPVQ